MTSRICSTSWSVSCDTRRASGIPTFSMISLAFFGPIPWIYCNAITTRLLVGMLTPAMRATVFHSFCRRAQGPAIVATGGGSQTITRHPPRSSGHGIVLPRDLYAVYLGIQRLFVILRPRPVLRRADLRPTALPRPDLVVFALVFDALAGVAAAARLATPLRPGLAGAFLVRA